MTMPWLVRWTLLVILLVPLAIPQAGVAQAQDRPNIETVPQIPHTREVNSVAFSPDGKQVLSGGWDNIIKLWDAASGKLVRSFQGHPGPVKSVVFSPDGRQVLSGSQGDLRRGDSNGAIMLWDAATGRLVRSFEGYAGGAG